MFRVSGDAYDFFMGRWSRRLAPALAEAAGITAGRRLLDVGCGPGALTGVLVELVGPSSVAACDPSEPFVAACAERHPGVDVRQAAAEDLPWPDQAFDVVLAQLVLNFVRDRAAAAAEMTRVLRPGGTVATAVWDYGEGMEMLRVFWDEAVKLKPDGDSRDERHMPFCREGDLAALWRLHGLQDIVEERLTIETQFASFADYWGPFLEKQGPAGAYVATLSGRERDELEGRLRGRLLGQGPDRAFVLEARAWAVRGER